MENLNFNKLPKSEKELPKEKDSQTEQRELDKREKVFLEIEGQNIEAEKAILNILKGFKKRPLSRDIQNIKFQSLLSRVSKRVTTNGQIEICKIKF